jgi:hypothetical protein
MRMWLGSVGARLTALLPGRTDMAERRRDPLRDVPPGLTVAIVALPLALGFSLSLLRAQRRGILSIAGYLGPDAVHRFTEAVGWVLVRGDGPVIVDLTPPHPTPPHCTALRGWLAEGQLAITAAAGRLADGGRSLELAAIPADGSLVSDGDCPPVPVHCDLTAAAFCRPRRAKRGCRGVTGVAEAAGAAHHGLGRLIARCGTDEGRRYVRALRCQWWLRRCPHDPLEPA